MFSVTAAGKQLKQPIKVPRPKPPPKPKPTTQAEVDAAFKKGIGVLAATSRRV